MKYKELFKLLGQTRISSTDTVMETIIKFILENYRQCVFCNKIYKNNNTAFCSTKCEVEYYKQMD